LLRLGSSPPTGYPEESVRELLCSVAEEAELFQTETPTANFDCLAECLRQSKDSGSIDAVLNFLDNVLGRYVRKPVYYQAQLEHLQSRLVAVRRVDGEKHHTHGIMPCVSPLLLTVVEQWPYVVKSQTISNPDKSEIARWISRWLNLSCQIGECKGMLNELVLSLCGDGGPEDCRKRFEGALEESSDTTHFVPKPSFDENGITGRLVTTTVHSNVQDDEEQDDLTVSLPVAPNAKHLFAWVKKDTQDVFEEGDAGRLAMCLCSDEVGVRIQAISGLRKLVAQLQQSTYAEKEMMTLLLQELIHSAADQIKAERFPTFLGVFAAQAMLIQANPQHFLYGKLNHFLLRSPGWQLDKVPLLAQILLNPPDNDKAHYEEVAWLLDVLARGLGTAQVSFCGTSLSPSAALIANRT
jgi:nucleolar pre-ribosomal-associated protein 1